VAFSRSRISLPVLKYGTLFSSTLRREAMYEFRFDHVSPKAVRPRAHAVPGLKMSHRPADRQLL
jgi:hypothetical protein